MARGPPAHQRAANPLPRVGVPALSTGPGTNATRGSELMTAGLRAPPQNGADRDGGVPKRWCQALAHYIFSPPLRESPRPAGWSPSRPRAPRQTTYASDPRDSPNERLPAWTPSPVAGAWACPTVGNVRTEGRGARSRSRPAPQANKRPEPELGQLETSIPRPLSARTPTPRPTGLRLAGVRARADLRDPSGRWRRTGITAGPRPTWCGSTKPRRRPGRRRRYAVPSPGRR